MNTDWREVKREGKRIGVAEGRRIGVADVDQRWEKRDSASQAGRACDAFTHITERRHVPLT
jgi:hypothetical protein